MSQQPERTHLDWPAFAGTPSSFCRDLCVGFTFGVSGSVPALPDRATSRGAHFRDVRQITEDEANELLVARIKGKVAAAVRQGRERAQLLLAHISRLRQHHTDPVVAAALDEALAKLERCQHAPAPQPDDPVTMLKAELAALTARLAALEVQGAKP